MGKIMAKAVSVGAFLFLAVALLSVPGCGGDAEEARQEAREAKKRVSTLELSLAKTQQQITDLKEELNVVRETRDELQKQVDLLVPELDKAQRVAGEAEQVITHLSTRAEGQNTTTATLQKEVADLKALVADQAALIEELQKAALEAPIPTDLPTEDDPAAIDPNADL